MRSLLNELPYEETLKVLAGALEVKDQRPYFSVSTRLFWLRKSLEEGEKLDIRTSVENEAPDYVAVRASICISKGGNVSYEADGVSRAYVDTRREDVCYDNRNYCCKNAYIGALDAALMLLGHSTEDLMMELTCSGFLTDEAIQDKIRLEDANADRKCPEGVEAGLAGMTSFAGKSQAPLKEDGAPMEAEPPAEVPETEQKEGTEQQGMEKQMEAEAEAEALPPEEPTQAGEGVELASGGSGEARLDEAAAAPEGGKQAEMPFEEAGQDAEAETAASGKLTFEEALEYTVPQNGSAYRGKKFADLYREHGMGGLIAFINYFRKSARPDDPMHRVYDALCPAG